jgi:hypothetical protein
MRRQPCLWKEDENVLELSMIMMHDMRCVVTAVVLSTLSLSGVHAQASSPDDNPTPLAALQAKADQAHPRDRCFLYAELVSKMADLAGQQVNSDNSEQASQTLKLIQRYAENIHVSVTDDSRKLKDAELLVQRTCLRFKNILHEASYEDRPALELTLRQLNEVHEQLMMQVFKR